MTPTKKKPAPEAETLPEPVQVAREVECPQHKGYTLQVEIEGNIAFAVCKCPTRDNVWKGKRVWETSLNNQPAPDNKE